jgi:hypothetical protein
VFYGYCYTEKGGRHTPRVNLETAEDVFRYVNLQKGIFPEVRITDDDDYIVVHALDGKIVYPPEWASFDNSEKIESIEE